MSVSVIGGEDGDSYILLEYFYTAVVVAVTHGLDRDKTTYI
jgi:hypothetical protein